MNQDLLLLAAAAVAAYMMMKNRTAAAAPSTYVSRQTAQPGAGTVGSFAPPVALRDYVRTAVPSYVSPLISSGNYSGVPGVYPGSQQDLMLQSQWDGESFGWNNLSNVEGVDYGSVQDQMLAAQW